MKKLEFKLCPYCGVRIVGKKRPDRNAYYYAPRCDGCARKSLSPEVQAIRKRVLASIRKVLPVGSRRMHKASDGFVYWLVKVEGFSRWQYEHRIIASAGDADHVHHINGDTLDNRPENLRLVNAAEHRQIHGDLIGWSKLFDRCQRCGTKDRRHLAKGLCTACYQRK